MGLKFMDKSKNVVEFYVLCNKLKNIVRTGWLDFNIQRERVESVAEHIYGTQMLAIAMWSEFKQNIDIKKVLCMIAIHELEETIIGDLTYLQIDKQTKRKIGLEAVHKILSKLDQGKTFEELILEYTEQKSAEALFVRQCDKLECDLQAKLYDEELCIDLNNQENSTAFKNGEIKEFKHPTKTWGEMWITRDQQLGLFKDEFMEVSDYILNNKINK